ncbi:Ribonuclease P protein subunit p30 [Allomyces javanicus]|nr:Ribonuclease P protein subunit p30 [Allomyces javanicus]
MLCDFNVAWPTSALNVQANVDAARKTAADLVALGYHVVAFNQVVQGKVPINLTNNVELVDPVEWKSDAQLIMTARGQGKQQIKQLSRVTVVLEDPSQVSSLSTAASNLNQFDLLAVCPTSEKLWSACCQTVECDIISLDLSQRLPFHFKHSMVGEAVRRGIMIEIAYSAAFKDNTAKRNLIANATNLMRVCKGRNIILSSGAKTVLETRGPLDVVNLGCLLGMNQDDAKHAISTNCRAALIHAETRRKTFRAAVTFEPVGDVPAESSWTVGLGGADDFVGFGNESESEEDDAMEG